MTENKNIAEEDKLLIYFQENIKNGELIDIIKNVTETKDDYIYIKDNVLYQITTSENQKHKTNNSISNIDLLECEDILKDKYNINKSFPLIIFKIDSYSRI